MKLANRLKFYGIGFGMGCVMVWVMFYQGDDARASWMPEGRVLEFLEDTEINISEKAKCQLACYGVASEFMDKAFWDNADVNFDESAIDRKPCPEYKITSTTADGKAITVYIESCEGCNDCDEGKLAKLRTVEMEGGLSCDCE